MAAAAALGGAAAARGGGAAAARCGGAAAATILARLLLYTELIRFVPDF